MHNPKVGRVDFFPFACEDRAITADLMMTTDSSQSVPCRVCYVNASLAMIKSSATKFFAPGCLARRNDENKWQTRRIAAAASAPSRRDASLRSCETETKAAHCPQPHAPGLCPGCLLVSCLSLPFFSPPSGRSFNTLIMPKPSSTKPVPTDSLHGSWMILSYGGRRVFAKRSSSYLVRRYVPSELHISIPVLST